MDENNKKTFKNNLLFEISEDKTEAFITLKSSPDSPLPDENYILSLLQNEGISSTVLNDEIKNMLENKVIDTPVCVARGVKTVPSQNGWIEYLYEKKIREFDPDGKEAVDHKSRSRIRTVSKGERIIRIHPPVNGNDGLSVNGEVILSGIPVEAKMPSGNNTGSDPEDSSYLIATDNGAVVKVNETKIDVLPLLEIQGNVDYAVGNIDFTGSLIIRGDILSGFTVKSTGSIQVFGVIEDAEVYAGGDIYALGCAGGSKGSIRAGGSISIIYAENSNLQSGKDIIADDYLINCISHADGIISVLKKRGLITGGTTVAFKSVEANIFGNSSGMKTVVSAGFSAELRQQLTLIDVEQTRNINNLGQINTALGNIRRLSMIKKQLPDNIIKQTNELTKMKEIIEENINVVLNRHEDILDRLSGTGDASIKVNNIMYQGVILNFPDIQKVIKEEIKKTVFRIEDGTLKNFPV